MSSSGFRRRGFGLRGARSTGPTNGFNGPRFPHPGFTHTQPPHRLPGLEKRIGSPNFVSWQQNKNFLPHSQYRGNVQFRPDNRGRVITGRGRIRYSGPGRPPPPQFCTGFVRNPVPRTPLLQDAQIENKSAIVTHIPFLGSEEERRQKITETADKLKQKLSSITEEELTNFWEDDLSILPNNRLEEQNIQSKGIPELRHEPPELDLTSTDFKDIGRVDCNNSKPEDINSIPNTDKISSIFKDKPSNETINTNDEIIIIDESNDESINILNSVHDQNILNQSNILENNECQKQISHDFSGSECIMENFNLQCNNAIKDLTLSHSSDIDETSTSSLKNDDINLTSIKLFNNSTIEESSDLNNVEMASVSEPASNVHDEVQVDTSQNQNTVQRDMKDTNKSISKNATIDQIDDADTKLIKEDLIQTNLQTDTSQEGTCQSSVSTSDSSESRLFSIPPSNKKKCSTSSSYGEANKLNNDKKANNTSVFQSGAFDMPPKFIPRIQRPKCQWMFQQSEKNSFFHGSQKLPFHSNQLTSQRHIISSKSDDLVSVIFDPRAPPPFTSNVPISNHDSQHNVLLSFSSKDLPPAFDPSEPPPNIRTNTIIESPNIQQSIQVIPSLDSRNQAVNNSQGVQMMQPLLTFDPRGPPPRISNTVISTNNKLLDFNPQQLPPKVHKWNETFPPPLISDPRLSSQERSNLITPLNSTLNMMTQNLMDTSLVSDFNAVSNSSQLHSINVASHQTFISNVQPNFQSLLPQTSNGQMMREFVLPPPSINITNIPPPPAKQLSLEQNSNSTQGITMDDGLEDMQEAMEFAKQIMNMTNEVKNEEISSVSSKLPLKPSEIPIPDEDESLSSSTDKICPNVVKNQKKGKHRNKKCKQNVGCEPVLITENQEETETIVEEQNIQNQNKDVELTLLTTDQVRPKVVFNLNSKTKKIHKSGEWRRTPISNHESNEIGQQNYNKEKMKSKKSFESKGSNVVQNKSQQTENSLKINLTGVVQSINTSVHEQLNNTFCHQDCSKSFNKPHSYSSTMVLSNNMCIQKAQKPKKESRKVDIPTSESTWKNRVISRFLKMSKNDICNMVNNSSLRKFDIAMKHLVKEKRPSLSLEMRNSEDEKMKEYDREEFMNQLNAMLDPGAVVGITDLPTEFIHHLSEVLQLDCMPFDLELSETQNVDINKIQSVDQSDASVMNISKCLVKDAKNQFPTEFSKHQNVCVKTIEDDMLYNEEDVSHFSLSQKSGNSSKNSLSNKLNTTVENIYKKQQPLFNEADLDNILSEVTDKTKQTTKHNVILPIKSEKSKSSSLMRTVTESLKSNTLLQIPIKTSADIDDIISVEIADVKSLIKYTDSDTSKMRKSNLEDRNAFRSERYERWNRKEQQDPDTFRNLTKEEWEAKYGSVNATSPLTITRKCASNSTENLTIEEKRDCRAQRYCSSDSLMRHLSLSPPTCEIPINKSSLDINDLEEIQRVEQTESSSNSSMSSSSDSNEETVASNVTKLLKVIKEKEKIAKKKSLNETIRDEVAAEIEKTWKEKSKYKEHKFRKREKRKRDKKEKRKKEKKKRRNRNSHFNVPKRNEQLEEFRLLTESEIKKEVIIKEEPVSTIEENVLSNNEINNFSNSTDKLADLISRNEPQNSQIEKEQISQVICDMTSSQLRNKPTIVSIMVQPKTKAQLKQMPEFNNTQEKQIIEKTIAVTNNSVINADSKRTNDKMEKNKHTISENRNERIDIVSPVGNSFHQINVSVNITEPSSYIQPHIETNNNTNGINSNSVTKVKVNNHCTNQEVVPAGTSTTTESRSSYKKIDIKEYKERALQKRLKEQATIEENIGTSISFSKSLYHNSLINATNPESLNMENETKALKVVSKGQLKDPRLTKTELVSNYTWENFNQQVKERINSVEKGQDINIFQTNKESSDLIKLKNAGESKFDLKEKSMIQLIDPDAGIFTSVVNTSTNDLKSSQDTTVVQDFEKCYKKLKILKPTVESAKFKNIRSEGSKELKLKKEKIKKSIEKKKQFVKIKKHIEKYKDQKVIENIQKSSITSSTNLPKIEETNSYEYSELHPNLEVIIDGKCNYKITKCPITGEANHVVSTNDDTNRVSVNKQITNQVNEEVLNQQIGDQETTEIQNCKSLTNLRNEINSINAINEKMIKTEENMIKLESVLTPDKESSISSIKHGYNSQTSIAKPIITEKCAANTKQSLDIINKKSYSLSECSDINAEENRSLENMENLITVTARINSISDIQDIQALKTVNENDNKNLKMKVNNSKEHEVKSPDSSNSSFKGFFPETSKENHRVSKVYNLKVNNENDKENIEEYPEQWLDLSLTDKFNIGSTYSDQAINNESSKIRKESNETMLLCNLTEKFQNVTENDTDGRIIHNNFVIADNIETGTKALEIEDENIIQEQNKTYDALIKQKGTLPVINIHNQNTFDEDSEPFIVLDEYIDDADEKSIEKLSSFDLHLEDCIARDADTFTSKHLQEKKDLMNIVTSPNFNSMSFKNLSAVCNIYSSQGENRSHVTTMEKKEKSFLSRKSTISPKQFTCEEKIKNVTNVISVDSEKSAAPILSHTELRTTNNFHTTHVPENNSQHNSECFNVTELEVISPKGKILLNLNTPTKTIIEESENLSIDDSSPSEMKMKFLELNEQKNSSKYKNKQGLDNDLVNQLISTSSEVKTSVNQDRCLNSIVKENTLKSLHETTSCKTNQRERNEVLHKIKHKFKLKHRKQRKRDASVKLNVVEVKYPSTKEAIMARMIEIDVEIHKLMTEKMTLYQILTNNPTPTEKNLQQNNIEHEHKEAEIPKGRSQTPSALMSQLIQNIEASPVKNQCAKKSIETVCMKDDMINATQSNISKIYKQEHHVEKKESCIPTCDSDENEITNTECNKSLVSKKRKNHKSERTVKKLKNTLNSNKSINDLQDEIIEKKQITETELMSKKVTTKEVTEEHNSSHISTNAVKHQENVHTVPIHPINEENSSNSDKVGTFINKTREETIDTTESQMFTSNIGQSKNEENCLLKDSETRIKTSVEKDVSFTSVTKLLENKTPERLTIYSDDSTWDTLLPNSSIHNQTKLNRGLALLEETYKKEIAKMRKTKVETRKKKKKKVQSISQTVNTLTPEEEDLPLSALCAKKLHRKKKLVNSQDQQLEQINNDQRLWKNVIAVINAVAENKTEKFCAERTERQSSDDNGNIVPDVADLERNSKSKLLDDEEKEAIFPSTLKNIEEINSSSTVHSKTFCKGTDQINSDPKKDTLQLILCFDKSQAYLHSEESIQQNLETNVTSKSTINLSEMAECNNMSINIEEGRIESCKQQTMGNSTEDRQLSVLGDSDTCIINSNTNNIHNSHINFPEINLYSEKLEEQKVGNIKESNLQKNPVIEELFDPLQIVPISQNSKKDANLVESNNYTNLTMNKISKEDCNSTVNINDLKHSLILYNKDDISNTLEESNCVFHNEYSINFKKHKGIRKRKTSNEENNNRNWASVSFDTYSTDALKSRETLSKKLSKHKKGTNKTPLRRSSRNAEETPKHIKLKSNINPQDIEQDLQQNKFQITSANILHTSLLEKEVDNTLPYPKKSKHQSSVFDKKKYRSGSTIVEMLPDQLTSNNEPVTEIKRYKQHKMSEMMNCKVRLTDCKYTILNPNVNSNILQKYGISTINSSGHLNTISMDSVINSTQLIPSKDSQSVCIKRKISTTECLQSEPLKIVKFGDITQFYNNKTNLTNMNNDKEEYINPDIDIMPILTKESVMVNISQNYEKPDIEVVEEKTMTTKNREYNNTESTLTVIDTKDDKELSRTQYTVHKGPILDMKVFENSFLAASEDGRIYRYNQASNGILNIYKGHKAAVTCLYVYNGISADINKEWMFSGSLDGTLRCYNIITGVQIRDIADIGSPIQCMDEAWGIIFIGTKSGHVSRYHMKSGVIKGDSIQFSDKSVLALKATNEGPRKVLIVASRSQPITIRDAQNGLFLRTICGQKSHTVYSLMRDNNLIYCGTSNTSIPVFDFTNGEQILQYDAGVGIVCMRLYKQLLFAGCYDGNIYVFDTKDRRLVCSIPGPGNMLLSMEIVDNKIIAGSKDKRLQSWQMPLQVRTLLLKVNQI